MEADPAKSACPLLDLPAELRNRIFYDVLLVDHSIEIDMNFGSPKPLISDPPLLATNRQIRQEGLSIFYVSNIFQASVIELAECFAKRFNPQKLSLIRSLRAEEVTPGRNHTVWLRRCPRFSWLDDDNFDSDTFDNHGLDNDDLDDDDLDDGPCYHADRRGHLSKRTIPQLRCLLEDFTSRYGVGRLSRNAVCLAVLVEEDDKRSTPLKCKWLNLDSLADYVSLRRRGKTVNVLRSRLASALGEDGVFRLGIEGKDFEIPDDPGRTNILS